jgi:hypothetical protein
MIPHSSGFEKGYQIYSGPNWSMFIFRSIHLSDAQYIVQQLLLSQGVAGVARIFA